MWNDGIAIQKILPQFDHPEDGSDGHGFLFRDQQVFGSNLIKLSRFVQIYFVFKSNRLNNKFLCIIKYYNVNL